MDGTGQGYAGHPISVEVWAAAVVHGCHDQERSREEIEIHIYDPGHWISSLSGIHPWCSFESIAVGQDLVVRGAGEWSGGEAGRGEEGQPRRITP
jgi:hypothetical protein